MRTFSYRARTTDGAEVRGHFAAESAPAAVRALAAPGRMVVRLEEGISSAVVLAYAQQHHGGGEDCMRS